MTRDSVSRSVWFGSSAAVIGCLRNGGFSIATAALAFSTLDAFSLGFGIQELNLPFSDERDVGDVAENLLAQFPADDYPFLRETIVDHALQPGYDYTVEFGRGLELILDGLERIRDEHRRDPAKCCRWCRHMEMSATRDTRRPAEDVFAFLADAATNLAWQRGMRSCAWTSMPPIGPGSTYEQRARFMGRDVRTTS